MRKNSSISEDLWIGDRGVFATWCYYSSLYYTKWDEGI